MGVFGTTHWLKSPADRDIIARWTVRRGEAATHALAFPPPPDPARFTFLALGDTGDSESAGPRVSPQDAVARELARDTCPAGSASAACILHTGDVIYMTGERRLYDRNFRSPYAPF